MRILTILPNLNGGGAQRIALDLARRFASNGDESLVCAAGSDGVLRAEVDQLKFYGFRPRIALFTIVPYVAFVLRSVRRSKPQVILVHLLPLNLLVLLLCLLRFVRIPVVAVEHSHLTAAHDSIGASRVRRFLVHRLIRLLYPQAGAIVGVSARVATDIATRMRCNAKVLAIPNGVDVDFIRRRKVERTDESARFETFSSPRLVAVGRLVPSKAFEDLLLAFVEVRTQAGFGTASLAILGDGPERVRLEERVSELGLEGAVWLPGFVKNPWAVMARAQIFVMSSHHEGFGLVVAVAVACGLPVVSTNCLSGPAEILEGNPRARLVPVGDWAAIAHEICDVLRTADSVRAVPIRRDYTIDETARRYRTLFADILTRRAPGLYVDT